MRRDRVNAPRAIVACDDAATLSLVRAAARAGDGARGDVGTLVVLSLAFFGTVAALVVTR